MVSISQQLTPDFLKSIRDFWFQHLTKDEEYVLPVMPTMMRWFAQSDSFDTACGSKFKPVLEDIKAANPSGDDIIAAANPQSPYDWLSIVLLLDQFPRNIYRGDASAVVFTFYDPLALDIALKAIDKGIDKSDAIRYRLTERMWFYLPLGHSEDLKLQERAVGEDQKIVALTKGLSEETIVQESEVAAKDAKVLLAGMENEDAKKFIDGFASFAVKHMDIIKQFGRFPHRNGPLGREPRPEEIKYLEEGGETFARKADESLDEK